MRHAMIALLASTSLAALAMGCNGGDGMNGSLPEPETPSTHAQTANCAGGCEYALVPSLTQASFSIATDSSGATLSQTIEPFAVTRPMTDGEYSIALGARAATP